MQKGRNTGKYKQQQELRQWLGTSCASTRRQSRQALSACQPLKLDPALSLVSHQDSNFVRLHPEHGPRVRGITQRVRCTREILALHRDLFKHWTSSVTQKRLLHKVSEIRTVVGDKACIIRGKEAVCQGRNWKPTSGQGMRLSGTIVLTSSGLIRNTDQG